MAAAAKEAQSAVDPEKRQDVALTIFTEMTRSLPPSYSVEHLAHAAFRRAETFLTIAGKVESGELSVAPIEAIKPKKKRIQKYRAKDDLTGWDPVTDENGQPVMEERFVDRFAFCPNLPDEHPINQLFEPEDGKKPSQRVKEARAALAIAN